MMAPLAASTDFRSVASIGLGPGLPVQPDAPPTSVAATALPPRLLVDLIAKHLLVGGDLPLGDLAERLALDRRILDELMTAMLEADQLRVAAARDGQLYVELSASGREIATAALARSGYLGPAPLALPQYERLVAANATGRERITRSEMDAAFAGVTVSEHTIDELGRGLNSARALLIYGPPGSGKTFLAERLVKALRGSTLIPHAIAVGDVVVPVYDPVLHDALETQDRICPDADGSEDRRLVACRRPALTSGIELTRDMLDVRFDPATRTMQAPLTLKANTGIYVVDDFGRQRIAVDELIQRWTLPMETRHDWLTLGDQQSVRVPFDVVLVLVTSLDIDQLGTDAFQRRIGHRVEIGEITREEYLQLWQQSCAALGIDASSALAARALDELHEPCRIPPLSSHPGELLANMLDQARYTDHGGAFTTDMLHQAWVARFGRRDRRDARLTAIHPSHPGAPLIASD